MFDSLKITKEKVARFGVTLGDRPVLLTKIAVSSEQCQQLIDKPDVAISYEFGPSEMFMIYNEASTEFSEFGD